MDIPTQNKGVTNLTEALEWPVASTSAFGSVPVERAVQRKEIGQSFFSKCVDLLLLAATEVDKQDSLRALTLPLPTTPQLKRGSPQPQPSTYSVNASLPVLTWSRKFGPTLSYSSTPGSQPRRPPSKRRVDSGRSPSPIPQLGSSWETISEPLDFTATITSKRNDSRLILPLQADTDFRPESSQDARLDDIRQACYYSNNIPQGPGSPWHDSSSTSGSPQLQIDWSSSSKPEMKMDTSRPASPVPFERLETPRPDSDDSEPPQTPVPELLRPVALRPKTNNA